MGIEPCPAPVRPLRRNRRLYIACWIALLIPTIATCDQWSVDDLVLGEGASGWTLAHDGSAAAWVQSSVSKIKGEEKRVSQLWLWRHEAEPLQLTRGVDGVSSPAFSPDGSRLAFLSSRTRSPDMPKAEEGAERQVWAIALAGGEPYPLTSLDRPVQSYAWLDDQTLLLLAAESASVWEKERKEAKDTTRIVEDAERTPPVRLFRYDVKKKDIARLGRNTDWILGAEVSPDGKTAVVQANQSLSYTFDGLVAPHTLVVDLATGERRRLFPQGEHLPSRIAWLADSSGFFFTEDFSSHPVYRTATVSRLHFHALDSGRTEEVDLSWERGQWGTLSTLGDGVLTLLADGVRNRAVKVAHDGRDWAWQELQGEHAASIEAMHLSRDGRLLIYRTSTATRPTQWYAAKVQGRDIVDPVQVTQLNGRYDGKPTGIVETVQWTGARGDTVEGLLHFPLDWSTDRGQSRPGSGRGQGPRPFMVEIHGGPASRDRDTWDVRYASPSLLYRQRGAFVLQVNYHGSSGYGLEWVESIEGRYYELEVPDIEAGVDHFIAMGLADPQRLGIYGWSNGGILTADIITRTDRYKAASIGAADVEWISDWANVDFGASFDNYYFGGPPWEKVQVYLDKSPFFRLTEVSTPTVIHTGTEDRNVPPHQSWSLFRALQQIGKTEARLALYPGEPHGLRKIAHQRRKAEEDLAWFDRYLFAETKKKTEQVRPGSPIAQLLARADAARHDGAYGEYRDGLLVPETLSFSDADLEPGVQVARFELTRAQAHSIDNAYQVRPGEQDLPLTGLSFQEAEDLVAKLAQKSGLAYRLPTAEEAKKLASAGGDGGNTLDRWAGYAPNPEDADQLRAAVADLDGPPALLLSVGSLKGAGKATEGGTVFDLDGNAAEWARTEDGSGVAIGASADQPSKIRDREAAAAEYTGLRVVLDSSQ